jgi:hypothetical protein
MRRKGTSTRNGARGAVLRLRSRAHGSAERLGLWSLALQISVWVPFFHYFGGLLARSLKLFRTLWASRIAVLVELGIGPALRTFFHFLLLP